MTVRDYAPGSIHASIPDSPRPVSQQRPPRSVPRGGSFPDRNRTRSGGTRGTTRRHAQSHETDHEPVPPRTADGRTPEGRHRVDPRSPCRLAREGRLYARTVHRRNGRTSRHEPLRNLGRIARLRYRNRDRRCRVVEKQTVRIRRTGSRAPRGCWPERARSLPTPMTASRSSRTEISSCYC